MDQEKLAAEAIAQGFVDTLRKFQSMYDEKLAEGAKNSNNPQEDTK